MAAAIKISNLYKKNRRNSLDKINLEVPKNSLFVLVGEAKSGKSTLLKIISGLQKETSGDIFLFGQNIKNNIYRKIGVVFDEISGYDSLSLYDNLQVNLMMQGVHKNGEIENIISFLELNTIQDKEISELSFFERGLMNLGIALVGQPDVLLLDEPLRGFSKTEAFAYAQKLAQLKETTGITIVVSSDNLRQWIDFADEVAFMQNRSIVHQISVEELLKKLNTTIEVKVDDAAKCCFILEQNLNIESYEVLENNVVEIYTKIAPEVINEVLVQNQIKVSELSQKIKNYGGYDV